MSIGNIGQKNHNWRGGKIKTVAGYFIVWKPQHPFANSRGYVLEHRLVMEKHLKRFLQPKEVVHHINENRQDNRIENLQLFRNRGEHIKFHFAHK